jgi:hypothetical protein
LRFTILATNNLEPCIDELEIFTVDGRNVALATTGARVTSSGDTTAADRHELRFVNDGQYGNSRSWMSSEMGRGWLIIDLPAPETVERVVWGRDREAVYADRLAIDYRIELADQEGVWHTVADASDRAEYKPGNKDPEPPSADSLEAADAQQLTALLERRRLLESQRVQAVAQQLVFSGNFRTPDTIRLLRRGDPEQPQEEVAPAVPDALGDVRLPADSDELVRRQSLADWITDARNPLTARVMANRIWQSHFGIGLVDTANDFGRNGTPPSHPELLDWLAAELIRCDWSVKALHRRIVLSATYRQSSAFSVAAAAVDADARWLWRFPPRRLDAEMIRDAMLAVSGQIHFQVGGPGFDLFNNRGGLSGFVPVESFGAEGSRRMIYAHKVRRERDAVFGAFDCPDAGQSTPRRRESTTPIQALNLFNSRFSLDQANALASRIRLEAGEDVAAQLEWAFQLTLNRAPTADEAAEARQVANQFGLPTVCRVLLNCNELLILP